MRSAQPDRGLALGLLLALLALTAVRLRPPAPLPQDADPAVFSSGRAREQLRAIAGDGRPRPVGSAAAADAREKIVAQLRALGYQPEVQDGFACSAVRTCAKVKNVVALRPGAQGTDGKLVIISAHYDSVMAGPGASDDGVGVAVILEIARALALEPPARNPVLLLINEGEEPGLIGAEAFVNDHPLAQRVAAVVNVEARGTAGPSLMFETSEGNGPLLSLSAAHQAYPLTNSVYYTVYKTLPNDTDLTVYKRVGMAGVNFAFIEGEVRYHTPRDDVAHADPASLQHQGQNALAMLRALAAADLDALHGDDAVFFDLFAFATVRWPEWWMRGLGVLGLALMLGGTLLAIRHGHARARQVAWGAGAALIALVAIAVLGAISLVALRLAGAVPYPLLAFSGPAKVAFWVLGLSVAAATGAALHGRARPSGLWLGPFLALALCGAVMAFAKPGLAYPFVVPALVAGALSLPWALTRPADLPPRWLWIPPFLAAGAVWLPLAWFLYDGLGVPGLAGTAIVFGLLLLPLAWMWGPALESRTLRRATALVWVVALAAQVVCPRYTEEHPRKLSLEYQVTLGASGPTAKWTALGWESSLPAPLHEAGKFATDVTQNYPWPGIRKTFAAPAPVLDLKPPVFEVERAVVEGGHLKIEARLSSPRGALNAGLVLPGAQLASMKVNGKAPPKQESKNLVPKLLAADGYVNLMDCTTGTEGARYELELTGPGPLQAWIWDATSGLPPEGAALLAARPANTVPFQYGNVTTVVRPVTLQAK